jgi:hypothetical protein
MGILRAAAPLDAAIDGSRRERFLIELFGNSAIFPLANILLELFQQGVPAYFQEQHFYTMCTAAIAQAVYLSGERGNVRVFAGNLIGPAIYTVIEALAEGPSFFGFLHHYEYWAFAGAIGALQAGREHVPGKAMASFMMIAEGMVRSSILLAMYATFELESTPCGCHGHKPRLLRRPQPHLHRLGDHAPRRGRGRLCGDLAALPRDAARPVAPAAASTRNGFSARFCSNRPSPIRRRSPWRVASARSSSWTCAASPLERDAVARNRRGGARLVLPDGGAGVRPPPADPLEILGRRDHGGLRVGAEALAAAGELAAAQREALHVRGLGAGIGLHWGPVVEGLIGGRLIKQFDVVGDTVNTAKRIEGEAAPGEILASEPFRTASGGLSRGERRVQVKGKSVPLVVHTLAGLTAIKPREARA